MQTEQTFMHLGVFKQECVQHDTLSRTGIRNNYSTTIVCVPISSATSRKEATMIIALTSLEVVDVVALS
ncbi:hypothetical protein TNCV_446331 [Trichonephila clavipes]|nr:hypothetical protein TNCV_446331 [Trichonephila clavipes]